MMDQTMMRAEECSDCNESHQQILTLEQVDTYLRDGVLVVDHVLSESQLNDARDGLENTLRRHGIDPSNLSETGHHLAHLSSTGGAGGVLDVFFEDWKITVATNEKLYRITSELWQAAYCHNGEAKQDLVVEDQWKWHPYGAWDCRKAFLYLDRIGYRLPTVLAEQLGTACSCSSNDETTTAAATNTKAMQKRSTIQRSLTPHLDCCPESFFDKNSNSKWRPIQCFVSLSDTLEPNHGGFECAPGFHKEFEAWSRNRPPTMITKKKRKPQKLRQRNDKSVPTPEYETMTIPAPCIGQYTHIRPVEDASILRRIQHVPVRAGSAVFWDVRLPHANAYRHNGTVPRAVVYCSFLPAEIPINRNYASRQWHQYWIKGRGPADQWITTSTTAAAAAVGEEEIDKTTNVHEGYIDDEKPWQETNTGTEGTAVDPILQQSVKVAASTPLSRKLVGLEPW